MWDPVWEKVFTSQRWGKYPSEDFIRAVVRAFGSRPDPAKVRILEIGCGTGANLWFLAQEGYSFAAVDGSAAGITLAGSLLDERSPGWRARGELLQGDIGVLPFPDDTFDMVIDCEAVTCNGIDESRAIYREAARVTRPGGILHSRTFATGSWGDGTGERIGHNLWICSDGPLADKGRARFTARDEIPALCSGWAVTNIGRLDRWSSETDPVIAEWLISATVAKG